MLFKKSWIVANPRFDELAPAVNRQPGYRQGGLVEQTAASQKKGVAAATGAGAKNKSLTKAALEELSFIICSTSYIECKRETLDSRL